MHTEWSHDDLETVTACPVCGHAGYELMFEALEDLAFGCAPGTWPMVRCRGCQSGYLRIRPKPTSLHRAYENYYTHTTSQRASGTLRGFAGRLVNGYRNWRYGSDLEPASALGILIALCLPPLRRRIDASTRFLPVVFRGARLLDVGVGGGGYLRLARQLGWKVSGVDFDPVVIEALEAEGFDLVLGDVSIMQGSSECFDAVTLNHTLEHVYTPRETMSQVFKLLKPGGFLYVETPNIDALGCRRFGECWRGLEAPRHLFLLSSSGCRELLEAAGFVECRQILRTEEYGRMALASRRLRGESPNFLIRVLERMVSLGASLIVRTDPSRAEFLTFLARKPG